MVTKNMNYIKLSDNHSHPSKVFIFYLSNSLKAHVYSDGLPGEI